jgi:hypothetical protein
MIEHSERQIDEIFGYESEDMNCVKTIQQMRHSRIEVVVHQMIQINTDTNYWNVKMNIQE